MKATKLVFFALLVLLGSISPASAWAANASETVEETIGEYTDDALVTSKIKAAFLKQTNLDSLKIHVKTIRGVVYLSGLIDTTANRKIAITIAKDTEGVKSVVDKMRVK